MLTIRAVQMEALTRSLRSAFEARMQAHLRTTFAGKASALGTQGLADLVRSGIDRAAKYGVETEPDLRRYLELALEYGVAFDADPKCAWASQILNQTGLDGTEKINLLDEYELFLPREGSG